MTKNIIVGITSAITGLIVFGGTFTILSRPEFVDGRFRTYKELYNLIQIGAPKSNVDELLLQLYPEGGKRKPPLIWENTESSLKMFMNPEKRIEPNCEGIFLRIENGIIASKHYSAD
ncbi:hypothetical protein P4E94_19725 [Pontiellaceae bacterium B12219]|nr:hypothetical protein [Pontiellaceae bacterium B12219]